jgi:hypothetical protein
MKFVSKVAALGAAAAISATGLVAATGTTANAATVNSVTYTCHLGPLGGDQQVTAAYTIPALPATVPAGIALPAQPISADITVPPAVSTIVVASFGGQISGTVNGNVAFGPQSIAASLTIPDQTITDANSSATVHSSGTLAAFTPTNVGTNAVSLPSAVTATLGGQAIACDAVAGSDLALGSVAVAAPLSVKAPKSVKAGHVLKLKVTTAATGKAVAKVKGKKVASAKVKAGKATLKIKKGLKKGKNKIVVTVGSLKQTVKVKVK